MDVVLLWFHCTADVSQRRYSSTHDGTTGGARIQPVVQAARLGSITVASRRREQRVKAQGAELLARLSCPPPRNGQLQQMIGQDRHNAR